MRHSFIFNRDQTRVRQCDIGAAVVLCFLCQRDIGSCKVKIWKLKVWNFFVVSVLENLSDIEHLKVWKLVFLESESLKVNVCSMLVATVRRATVSICCTPSKLRCCIISSSAAVTRVERSKSNKQTNKGGWKFYFPVVTLQFICMVNCLVFLSQDLLKSILLHTRVFREMTKIYNS